MRKPLRLGDSVTAFKQYLMPDLDYDGQVVMVVAVSPCGTWVSVRRPNASHESGYLPAKKFKIIRRRRVTS